MPITAKPQQSTSLNTWHKVCNELAARVRVESKSSARLTSIDTLKSLYPGLTSQDLANMLQEEGYRDIRTIITRTGDEYFYSSQHVSNTYATFLARAAANDPVATIGETVRDESQIYPRPTQLELFVDPVFNVDSDKLETYADAVLARFLDIKKLTASTGATYLYSTEHMSEGQAQSLMEWNEVEQYENH